MTDTIGNLQAVYAAVGTRQFTISDVRDVIASPHVLRALKNRDYLIQISRHSSAGPRHNRPAQYRINTASPRVQRLLGVPCK